MNEQKVCPLLGAGPLDDINCKKSRFGWWDDECKSCTLVSIAQALNGLDRDGICTFPTA